MKAKRFLTAIAALALVATAYGRHPSRGYRGFVDWSSDVRREKVFNGSATNFVTGVTTTHGCQFNPWLFAGGGVGVEYGSKFGNYIVPIYADVRFDPLMGSFSPFADIRLGYSCTDGGGVYFSPSVGYRIDLGRKVGINIGLGMSVKGWKSDVYEIGYYSDYYYANYIGTHRSADVFFNFRVGIDF